MIFRPSQPKRPRFQRLKLLHVNILFSNGHCVSKSGTSSVLNREAYLLEEVNDIQRKFQVYDFTTDMIDMQFYSLWYEKYPYDFHA